MSESGCCPECDAELSVAATGGLCPRCLLAAGLDSSEEEVNARPAPRDPATDPQEVTTPQSVGFRPPAPSELAPYFPQLEILGLLGQGGMGAVYQSRQTKLDRMVALKIIRPESAADPAFAERFMREARTLARLSHPHIVAVHDFGEVHRDPEAPLYYFVMEYVDGVNLRQMMQTGDLDTDEALAIVPQVCDALQYAHDEGIIHRDIKPENILIDRRGRVKIADFGLAKLAARSPDDFTLTATHQVMGTPRYMAPEQMAGSRQVDHRADIYSLGVVFYEMLTGEVPLGRFEPPSRRASIDARLDDVVLRALASDPDQRYQRASELRTHLGVLHDDDESMLSAPHDQSGPAHARGLSTIIDDGIAGVVRSVRDGSPREVLKHPSIPGILALLLAFGGVMTMFMPWVHVIGAGKYFHPFDTVTGSLIGALFLLLMLGHLMDSGSPSDPRARGGFTILFGAVILFLLWLFKSINVDWVREFEPQLDGGFFTAFAFAMGLLLVGTWDVRSGIARAQVPAPRAPRPAAKSRLAARVGAQRDDAEQPSGDRGAWAPTAHVGFTVPDAGTIGPRVVSHFSLLGYRLAEERTDEWIFQRGTRMAALADFDIRRYHTTLTIRTGLQPEGRWVSCGWAVTTYGAYISGKDIRTLETEGRELEAALRQDIAGPPAQGSPESPRQVLSARQRTSAEEDASDLELHAEIDGPSLAMMILGLLMVVGHAIAVVYVVRAADVPRHSGLGTYLSGGVIIGTLMFAGGLNLRNLWSHGWGLVGAFAGCVPLSPAWPLTIIIGLWAWYVLDRAHVRQAFIERARRRQQASAARKTGGGSRRTPVVWTLTLILALLCGVALWVLNRVREGGP